MLSQKLSLEWYSTGCRRAVLIGWVENSLDAFLAPCYSGNSNYKLTQKIIEFPWLYLFYFSVSFFFCLDLRNSESKPTSRLVFYNVCLFFFSLINWLTDFCKAGKRGLSPSAIIYLASSGNFLKILPKPKISRF